MRDDDAAMTDAEKLKTKQFRDAIIRAKTILREMEDDLLDNLTKEYTDALGIEACKAIGTITGLADAIRILHRPIEKETDNAE
jgi:hypothetical protein